MRSPNRHGQPAARARARAMQRRLCGGTPAELQRAQRTRLLMLLCVAGAIISSARICRPLGSAGVAFEQLPLWTGGHRVVGRKGNRKRRRLVWSDRLGQIQNEIEWRRRYKISSSCFRGMVNALRSQLEAQDVQQAARSSGGLITAELRLSMALRYMAGGHYIDTCCCCSPHYPLLPLPEPPAATGPRTSCCYSSPHLLLLPLPAPPAATAPRTTCCYRSPHHLLLLPEPLSTKILRNAERYQHITTTMLGPPFL